MSDTPKYTARSISRDINYLIGGGCIVASFLHCFGLLALNSVPAFLFAAGIAYVVGYAVHDWAGILRIVSAVPTRKAGPKRQWLYRQFTHEQWQNVEALDVGKAEEKLQTRLQKNELAHFDYERIISLMHIGTVMTPSCWVSAALLLLRWIFVGRHLFDGTLVFVALLFGIGFYYLAWLKNMQWTQRLAQTHRAEDKSKEEDGSVVANRPQAEDKPKEQDRPRAKAKPQKQPSPRPKTTRRKTTTTKRKTKRRQ